MPNNPTLRDRITLILFDGARFTTTGKISRLPQTEGQLEGAFSKSGLNCWVQPFSAPGQVAFVEGINPNTGTLDDWRVLDRETTNSREITGSTRFQLVEGEPAVVAFRDFLAADFNTDDFA